MKSSAYSHGRGLHRCRGYTVSGGVEDAITVATVLVVSSKRVARQVPLPRWLMILGGLGSALIAVVVALLIWSRL